MKGAGRIDFSARPPIKPPSNARQPLRRRVAGAIMDGTPPEVSIMRTLSAISLTLAACLSAVPAQAASHQLVLTDPGYALWEIRPLDRRVYVLTLQGDWKAPADPDAGYYVNIEYANGGVVTHRVLDNRMFWKGDVQCLLIQYQWEKNHFQKGDTLTVFVTRKKPGIPPDDQEVISNRLEVAWPFDRQVVRLAPRTRFTEREPVDAFHPEAEEPVRSPRPTTPPVLPRPEEPVKSPEK
jgi:hypothetical protein